MPVPQQGEVWLIDLGLAAKVRPCLVVSVPPSDVDRALVTVIPQTTAVRGSKFEVVLPLKFTKSDSAFDAQNLISIPLSKPLRRLGKLTDSQLESVKSILREWLAL